MCFFIIVCCVFEDLLSKNVLSCFVGLFVVLFPQFLSCLCSFSEVV